MNLLKDINEVIQHSIQKVKPNESVKRALDDIKLPSGNLYVVSIGKAAWEMAHTTSQVLSSEVKKGIVITKYHHSHGDINNFIIYEAGHPLVDENSIIATKEVLNLVKNLNENDLVLFLVSGGGSSLFESPLVELDELKDITDKLLKSGANIHEINSIRKRLSKVKGGKFAKLCLPAQVKTIILSDVIGDDLSTIASGPTYEDETSNEEVIEILNKYKIDISEETKTLLLIKDVIKINNVENHITLNVEKFCDEAKLKLTELGYRVNVLTSSMQGEAREVGKTIARLANYCQGNEYPTAIILGGETTVTIKGDGKGGRNQEIILSASEYIRDIDNVVIFSIGSDGTDGPTDAAGAYCDGKTYNELISKNIDVKKELENNNSYQVLNANNNLIFTGPTGTNVNDISVLLIKPKIRKGKNGKIS